MYQGKFAAHNSRRRRGGKAGTWFLSILLLVTLAVGGTVAYLITRDQPVTNTFLPSYVTSEVTEEFDGTTKTHVNVKNTGDTEAYVRVRLVTYRVNDAGDRIGGAATIPKFTPGTGWISVGMYYYYTLPVAPGGKPAADLIESIELQAYDDADGGKQVIEVMAEAIQSKPAAAVEEAWTDVYVDADGNLASKGGN